jgi:hypothetical protein
LAEVDAAIVAAVEMEKPVTVCGVFYRVEAAGMVEKTDAGYALVGRQLLKLRRSGGVPYAAITDGTRFLRKPRSWYDLDQMLDDAAASYRRALWNDQSVDVHIFSEKDAITGVVYPVTEAWDVNLGVLRGYASESFAWNVAAGLVIHAEVPVYMYQLGDHDPSGVDAWREFEEKVRGFAPDAEVYFERLAVTPEQVNEYGLPTRPTKPTDSRAARFNGGSVEVDAIPPTELRRIVRQAITQHIDPEALRQTRIAEESERELFARMRGAS